VHNKTFERNSRLEGEIRSVLADLLRADVNDPRLDGVTVSSVRLTADRSKARVYFSLVGEPEREREASDGFAAAAPFLRRQLGQRMRLRVVPTLEFFPRHVVRVRRQDGATLRPSFRRGPPA